MATVTETNNPWEVEVQAIEFVQRQSPRRGVNAAVQMSLFAFNSVAVGYAAMVACSKPSLAAVLGTGGLFVLDLLCAKCAQKAFKKYLKLDALKYSVNEGVKYVKEGGDKEIFLRQRFNKDGLLKDVSFRTKSHELSEILNNYRNADLRMLKHFMFFLGFVAANMGMQLHQHNLHRALLNAQESAEALPIESQESLGH